MSAIGISEALTDLFRTPLRAVVEAEREYRKIWADWLEAKLALLTDASGNFRPDVDMNQILQTAPVVDLNGIYDLAITMRIAEAKKSSGGVSGGLAVGPIYASGNYGFASQRSQESTFQASASITITNTTLDLQQYLSQHALKVDSPARLEEAIKLLKSVPDPTLAAGAPAGDPAGTGS